jgi:hypothetical protein
MLFEKMYENVEYFAIFCNLVSILNFGVDAKAAAEVKVEIWVSCTLANLEQ